MSFFGNSSKQKDNPSAEDREASDLLDAFGQAERETPLSRPGRFGAVAAQLATKDNTMLQQGFRFRPIWAVGGGVALIAATVGVSTWMKMNADFVPADQKNVSIRVLGQKAVPASARGIENGMPPQMAQEDTVQSRALASYGNGISAAADPVFLSTEYAGGGLLGSDRMAMMPFVVTVKNTGSTIQGKIVIRSGYDNGSGSNTKDRVYNYPITIPGNGQITRQTVYANVSTQWARSRYDITLEVPGKVLGLMGSFISSPSNDYRDHMVAIIDKRPGVLSFRRDIRANAILAPQYHPLYVKPENAPDRAMGYESIDTLVLGRGAENLSQVQWEAIRNWVKDGGSLLLLGGEQMKALQENPYVKELSPAKTLAQSTWGDGQRLRFHVQSSDSATRFAEGVLSGDLTIATELKPGANRVERLYFDRGTGSQRLHETLAATRQFGAGGVTWIGFDPTSREVRAQAKPLTALWNVMSNTSDAVFSASDIRSMGAESPWVGYHSYQDNNNNYQTLPYAREGFGIPLSKNAPSDNPFRVELPPLQTVLYVFLGYFVLVVPVSFVVLKQTRRMHLAWATGPVLAITFAGGLATFTMKLYQASLSQRTAGIIALEAGEGKGRFHGFTEMYMPRSGQYTVNLPGTERTLDLMGRNSVYQPQDPSSVSGLTTTEELGDETPAKLNIPNLAFRRIFHSQTMSLGNGITAELHLNKEGELTGTLDNSTGLTLRNVVIVARSKPKLVDVRARTNDGKWFTSKRKTTPVRQYDLNEIKPGRTVVNVTGHQATDVGNDWDNLTPLLRNALYWQRRNLYYEDGQQDISATAILTAQTSGAAFGPQELGKIVGGESSVGLMVRLPALNETSESTESKTAMAMLTKGGAVR